jgi:hypothetical protein
MGHESFLFSKADLEELVIATNTITDLVIHPGT